MSAAVPLTTTDVANIGKFLRVINASFNNAISIQRNNAALALENSASTDPNKKNTVNMLLSLSNVEALDAIRTWTRGRAACPAGLPAPLRTRRKVALPTQG